MQESAYIASQGMYMYTHTWLGTDMSTSVTVFRCDTVYSI